MKTTLLIIFSLIYMSSLRASDEEVLRSYIQFINPSLNFYQILTLPRTINKICKNTSFDCSPFIGIMQVESHFKSDAVRMVNNKTSSVGLMQIDLNVWVNNKHKNNLLTKNIIDSKLDLYYPSPNIKAGIFVYWINQKVCQKRAKQGRLGIYKSIKQCTITRYNGSTKKHEYYNKVVKAMEQFKRFFGKRFKKSKALSVRLMLGKILSTTKNV